MTAKAKKKEQKVTLDYCCDDYGKNFVAMAEDSIKPEYDENAS